MSGATPGIIRAGEFIDGEPSGLASISPEAPDDEALEVGVELTEERYAEQIATIHEYIRAGDVYQLNFTFPLRFAAPKSAAGLYAELTPAASGVERLSTGNARSMFWSYSPEPFFRIDGDGDVRRILRSPCGERRAGAGLRRKI